MIRREVAKFLIVGSLTVLIDFATYRILLWSELIYLDHAKATGFITGTIFAYFANRFWTFSHNQSAKGSYIRFALLYLITLATNVKLNALFISLFQSFSHQIQIAFLIATIVSATLNFIGMKWFVFKGNLKEAI